MHALLAILSLRTFLTFATTAFAIAVVMLSLNIITVHEIAQILSLNPEAEIALTKVVEGLQHTMNQVLNIISQLLNKMFNWAGVDVDLQKIHVDVNQNPPSPPTPVDSPAVNPANGGSKFVPLDGVNNSK